MASGAPPSAPAPPRPWQVIAVGMVSLAVAMGIGRFAFTPLMPMMLADGVVELRGASWLATANYLGYLLGALLCMVLPWCWRRLGASTPPNAPRMVRGGLVATALLTLGMALPWPAAWPTLRFAAGIASALVLVHVSSWCLGQLARAGATHQGAVMYMGPGAGIVVSGLMAGGMVAMGHASATGWLVFGVLALLLTAPLWPLLHPGNELPSPTPAQRSAQAATAATRSRRAEILLLALAYALAGFGYIVTATFLPVIARQQLPPSPWLDLFWPLFGAGVMGGAFIASRLRPVHELRWRLVACYALQSLGIVVGLVSVSVPGFALGSLLLGLPFTAITYYTLQEARRLRPQQTASLMGLLTATYGLGQIAGPPMTAAILAHSATAAGGFTLALEVAATALACGALLSGVSARWLPQQPAAPDAR